MAGRTSLADLPRLLRNCVLYIGNDSGPKHIAAAVGIPTVGIHSGVVDPVEWGPIGPNAVALRRNMACSPCYLANAEDCPRSLACLRLFEPNMVYETADLLLKRPRPAIRLPAASSRSCGSGYRLAGPRRAGHCQAALSRPMRLLHTRSPLDPPSDKCPLPCRRRRQKNRCARRSFAAPTRHGAGMMDDLSLLALATDLADRAGSGDPRHPRPRLPGASKGRPVRRDRGGPCGRGDHPRRSARRAARLPGGRRGRGRRLAGSPTPAAEFWLVDPLDGTREFTAAATISPSISAWCATARPVLGVVGVPATGEIYGGIVGVGAWRQKDGHRTPIAVRPVPAEGLTVVASRHHGDQARLDAFLGGRTVARVVNFGSSLKFCRVAEGQADLYPRFGRTMEWDTCAPQAVLEAAGGSVETLDGTAAALRQSRAGTTPTSSAGASIGAPNRWLGSPPRLDLRPACSAARTTRQRLRNRQRQPHAHTGVTGSADGRGNAAAAARSRVTPPRPSRPRPPPPPASSDDTAPDSDACPSDP